MKKVFNLSVILAVLMSALTFTSCDDTEDAPAVNILVETTATSAIVSVDCEEDLTSVELWADGGKLKSIDVKDGKKTGNTTVFTISGLETGKKYSVKVTSKEDGAAEKDFTVGNTTTAPETFSLKVGGSKSKEGSYISIKNKAVYTTANANANASAIEIIFDGETFKSAKESTNTAFKAEASAIVKTTDAGWSFETSTGYVGTIVFDGGDIDGLQTYKINVTRSAK